MDRAPDLYHIADPPDKASEGMSSDMRVMLVCDVPAELTALQHVLRGMDMRVDIAAGPENVLEQAKSTIPAVLLLDAAMADLATEQLVRILNRYPPTGATAILVVAPPSCDDRTLSKLRSLEVFSILQRPLTCGSLRETFISAVHHHRSIDSARRGLGRDRSTHVVPGCNSLLRRELQCPFHSYGVKVNHYALRAGRLYAETDPFDLPRYRQGLRGNDFIDYHRAGLIICPTCFFATNDPGYFVDPQQPAPAGEVGAWEDPVLQQAVTAGASVREMAVFERLGGPPASTLFTHERSVKEALLGYELAIESSRALYDAGPARRRLELLRIGNHELRRALLLEQAGQPLGRIFARRRSAVEWLQRAYSELRGVGHYKAAYQLLALHIWMDDDASAFPYLNGLKELTRRSRRELDDPAALERYLRQAQALWSDRQQYRRPEVAQAA